ncbi:MAG: von Willebrand factor type [Myxococcales bacterium]|nr:von Willebrand factor type [Myxococcales bacterium]
MTGAALLPLCLLAVTTADPRPPAQQITVDVRGPLALVEVTRPLTADNVRGGELLLDIALPEGAALVDVQVREGQGTARRWHPLEIADAKVATETTLARLRARGFPPAAEPYDDATTLRLRVTGEPHAAVEVRFRFSLLVGLANGRRRIQLPASTERLPLPADVRVSAPGAVDLRIAGAAARSGATTRVPARSAWEISWTVPTPRAAARPTLTAERAVAEAGGGVTLSATAIDAHPGRDHGPPSEVLFVIDRSRSVGVAGAAAERDLAHALLDLLPPSTRFDALFFDQTRKRLFPVSRTATREALAAIDVELLPDHLENGTDLLAALREAGELLRRDAAGPSRRVLLALVTDGALPAGVAASALDEALGATPGESLQLGIWIVRPVDDEAAPGDSVKVLRELVASRGGVVRELRANQLAEELPSALAALAAGGDVANIAARDGDARVLLAERLAPGARWQGYGVTPRRSPHEVITAKVGAGATELRAIPRTVRVERSWLAPHVGTAPAPSPLLLATDTLVALVEPVSHPVAAAPAAPKGSLDREVVRNTLALAYLPRARACYLSRSGATPAERDLAGRVRLDIDLARGEVGRVAVVSSTLASPGVEACLRQGALALDVPRALRNDFPVTARLNLVFRPRTPEKATTADERALGEQIDLIIEDLHRAEPPASTQSPAADRSMIPTR